jgi:hypothetical protein
LSEGKEQHDATAAAKQQQQQKNSTRNFPPQYCIPINKWLIPREVEFNHLRDFDSSVYLYLEAKTLSIAAKFFRVTNI